MSIFPILYESKTKTHTTHAQHFTSPRQFVDQAHELFTNTAPKAMNDRRGDTCEYYDHAQDFNGYLSGQQQRDNIINRKCSEAVRQRVHAATIELNAGMTAHMELDQVDMYHDESGQFLDSNAYFNDDEFNMVSMEVQPQTRPIVYLAVSITAACSWNDNHFCNRGIAVIRAVHALERQGVSVGVIGYAVTKVSDTKQARTTKKHQRPIITILIKAPEQALDESNLINTMTNAGLMRNAGFQVYYYLLAAPSGGLGQPQTLTREDLKHAGLGDTELAILPYSSGDKAQYATVEGASALVTAAVNKQTSINL